METGGYLYVSRSVHRPSPKHINRARYLPLLTIPLHPHFYLTTITAISILSLSIVYYVTVYVCSLYVGLCSLTPSNTREGQTKIPVPQKPNASPIFTGRKDILEKLGKIFIDCANIRLRRCCLLWGMGGIGKTQICLKFTEEMSDR